MTTIEHLTVALARMARKCAHWRELAACTMDAVATAAEEKYAAKDKLREADAPHAIEHDENSECRLFIPLCEPVEKEARP